MRSKLLDNSVVDCLTCQHDTGQIPQLFFKSRQQKKIIKQFNSHPQHKVVTIVTLTTISIVIKSHLPTFEGPEWWPTLRKSKHLEVLNQIKNWLREHTFYLYILTDVLIL